MCHLSAGLGLHCLSAENFLKATYSERIGRAQKLVHLGSEGTKGCKFHVAVTHTGVKQMDFFLVMKLFKP